MAAFDDGRVGLWVNSAANLQRLPKIATVFGGMFTDVFIPHTSSATSMDRIRATKRPDGSTLRAHIHAIPHELSVADFCADVRAAIKRCNPGVVELNIEPNTTTRSTDAEYAGYIRDTLLNLHTTNPNMRFRVNTPPRKGHVLPADLIAAVDRFYVCQQVYYGDMSRFSEAEALADMEDHGIPRSRCGICYGVQDGRRDRLILPNLYYQGRLVAKLQKGIVFSDDLLDELGVFSTGAVAAFKRVRAGLPARSSLIHAEAA